MISHHIIYDITCTVFMISLPLYLTLHPLYMCHHKHTIDDLRPAVYMISHPLYVCHLMQYRKRDIHSLWPHLIVDITLHILHSRHHTHYIWHHTHDNTHVISAISPPTSDTISNVSVSSNPVYQLNHTHSVWHHMNYIYDNIFSMHGITWTLYDIIPIYVWHHT